MKKFWIIILIIILINIVIGLCGILMRAIMGGENIFMSFGKVDRIAENIRKEEKINIEGIEDLNLDFKASDANIILTDGNEIRIVQYAKKDLKEKQLFKMNNTEKTINVSEGKIGFHLFYFNSVAYDIYVPKKYENNLKVFSASGDIVIAEKMKLKKISISLTSGDCIISSDLIAEEAIIKSTSGDVKVGNVEVNRLEMSSTSGDVKVNGDLVSSNVLLKSVSGTVETGKIESEKIEAESTSGDVKILEVTNGQIDVKSVSGDIKIEIINGKADLKTTSGDIVVTKFEVLGDSNVSSTSGDVKINLGENSNCNIDTSTISGSSKVSNSNIGDGKFKFKIKTTSGDIKVY